jgi:hypothetical protein
VTNAPFHLIAEVTSDCTTAIGPVLAQLVGGTVTETPEGSRRNALAAVPVRPAVGRLSSTLDGGASCCGRRCTLASNGVGVRVGR